MALKAELETKKPKLLKLMEPFYLSFFASVNLNILFCRVVILDSVTLGRLKIPIKISIALNSGNF